MRVVSFKLDEDLLEILESLAKKKHLTKSEIIRRALRNYINESQDRPYITRRIRVY